MRPGSLQASPWCSGGSRRWRTPATQPTGRPGPRCWLQPIAGPSEHRHVPVSAASLKASPGYRLQPGEPPCASRSPASPAEGRECPDSVRSRRARRRWGRWQVWPIQGYARGAHRGVGARWVANGVASGRLPAEPLPPGPPPTSTGGGRCCGCCRWPPQGAPPRNAQTRCDPLPEPRQPLVEFVDTSQPQCARPHCNPAPDGEPAAREAAVSDHPDAHRRCVIVGEHLRHRHRRRGVYSHRNPDAYRIVLGESAKKPLRDPAVLGYTRTDQRGELWAQRQVSQDTCRCVGM